MAAPVISLLLWFAQGMGSGGHLAPPPLPKAFRDLKPPAIELRDVAATSGLTVANRYGSPDSKRHILEMTGNGVGIVDVDNDGLPDLILPDGRQPLLYRNRGGGKFAAVPNAFPAQDWGQGICAGDFDNDGFTDVLLTYYGPNRLFRNVSGRFSDVTASAGLPSTGTHFSTGCGFFDYDRDGRLDLLVANYVAFDLASAARPGATKFCTWKGLPVFCGPRGFPTDHPMLYHNEGNGKFRDVTTAAIRGLEGLHYGLGVITADFDEDGWPDAYIACDSTPGILLHNNHDGTFTDVAVEAGAAYGQDGGELGSMGVAAADVDGNGHLDILKTNFIEESPSLYRNLGDMFFEDATVESGLAYYAQSVGWGLAAGDFDQDGKPDLFIANGHIYPELGASYPQTNSLFWNAGGRYASVSGSGLTSKAVSRGAAAGDLNGDGALEVVVSNMNAPPSFYENSSPKQNALILQLEGTKSNRSAIGARVVVSTGDRKRVEEVHSGGSYASQNDLRLHFGLGSSAKADKVEIRWPAGQSESLTDLAAGQTIVIREGEGVVKRVAWRP